MKYTNFGWGFFEATFPQEASLEVFRSVKTAWHFFPLPRRHSFFLPLPVHFSLQQIAAPVKVFRCHHLFGGFFLCCSIGMRDLRIMIRFRELKKFRCSINWKKSFWKLNPICRQSVQLTGIWWQCKSVRCVRSTLSESAFVILKVKVSEK